MRVEARLAPSARGQASTDDARRSAARRSARGQASTRHYASRSSSCSTRLAALHEAGEHPIMLCFESESSRTHTDSEARHPAGRGSEPHPCRWPAQFREAFGRKAEQIFAVVRERRRNGPYRAPPGRKG